MKKLSISLASVCLILLPLAIRGQADPSASVSNTMPSSNFGFNLPTHLGTLSYGLSASEMLQIGYVNGVHPDTALSGNLAYISKSDQDPFSMVYTGGYVFSTVPGSKSSSTFQDLALSQVFRTRAWTFVVSDGFSLLPGAPTTGFSGVAGVGDIGVPPVPPGLGPEQSILTTYSNRISNGLDGSATWQIGPSLDLEGSAGWQVLHFLGGGNSGLDSSSYSGRFGPNYRIDARDSFGADAYYSYSTYPSYVSYKIETEGVDANFSRSWTRRLNTTVSVGPQITHGQTTGNIPARTALSVQASANYATRTTGFTASYSRGVNAGSGVIFGALSDTFGVGFTRPLSRSWQLGANGTYSRSTGLAKYLGVLPRYDSEFAGAQLSHRLTETLSCYGSLTAIHQSSQNNFGTNAYNGSYQVLGFGITFAPAPLISGR